MFFDSNQKYESEHKWEHRSFCWCHNAQSLFITSWIFFFSLLLLFALRCHCQGFIIWRNVCVYVNKRSKFSIHTLYSGSSNSAVLLFIVELHASIVTPFPLKFFTFNFYIVLFFSFSQEAFHFRHVVSLFYVNRNTCKCVINSIIYVKTTFPLITSIAILWRTLSRCRSNK